MSESGDKDDSHGSQEDGQVIWASFKRESGGVCARRRPFFVSMAIILLRRVCPRRQCDDAPMARYGIFRSHGR